MAMSEGVYSTEDIQKQCEENINYVWLLQGYPSPRHMRFQRFFARYSLKVITNLFTQVMEAIARGDTLSLTKYLLMEQK